MLSPFFFAELYLKYTFNYTSTVLKKRAGTIDFLRRLRRKIFLSKNDFFLLNRLLFCCRCDNIKSPKRFGDLKFWCKRGIRC